MLDFVNLLCLNAVLVLYDSGDTYYEYVVVTDSATFSGDWQHWCGVRCLRWLLRWLSV